MENNKLETHKQPVKKLISYLVLGKTSPLCLNMPLMKLIKNKSRHNFINNLLSATYFGFVSHLQAEYTIVVWTVYYNALNGCDEISSYIIMEWYKK